MSEAWCDAQVYCPACGHADIARYPNNAPVADFLCPVCSEDYELKCQKMPFGRKVLDGAYDTMIERLNGNRNPSLFLLRYDLTSLTVTNLLVVPKHFFVPAIIEKRLPLKASARRAGWTGCKIILYDVPASGRITLIQDGRVRAQSHVVGEWQAGLFLWDKANMFSRSWLLNVMKCIESLGRDTFSLDDI
jgi:type II restriction enzyme